jgi:hypothetical protein
LLLAAWITVPLIAQDNGAAQPVGFPTDWSSNHLIFTDGGDTQSQLDARLDPRYSMQQMRRNAPRWQQQLPQVANSPGMAAGAEAESAPELVRRPPIPKRPLDSRSPPESDLKGDWNFNTSRTNDGASVAPYMYPAKYTFNPIGAASCASDFVVFGANEAWFSTQANLMGITNLYVGQTSTSPLCGTPSGSNGGSGSAPTPQVKWAFGTGSLSGQFVTTSMALSLDGAKVAYVHSWPTSTSGPSSPVLKVFTLGSGAIGTITAPYSGFGACGTAAPSICNVTLSSSSYDTNSSPFVDYTTDTGYVGDNSGWLYKITNFFSVNGTAPAIASGWPIAAGGGILTAPVYDLATDTVFVASNDGYLYAFNATTRAAVTGSPLSLAGTDSLSRPGMNSAPIVDSTNHVLYAFFDSNYYHGHGGLAGCTASNTCGGVAQVVYYDHTAGKVELVAGDGIATDALTAGTPGTTSTAVAGTNMTALQTTVQGWIIPDGAFSQSYFNSFSPNTSFLYTCGSYTSGSPYGVTLQQFRFDSNRVLQSTVSVVNTLTTTGESPFRPLVDLCSPVTEFYNTGTSTDYLFVGVPATNGVYSVDITNNSAGTSGTLSTSSTTPVGGTSGIIVDGADPSSQASSLYFTGLMGQGVGACTNTTSASPANAGIGVSDSYSEICFFKLTQSGLK